MQYLCLCDVPDFQMASAVSAVRNSNLGRGKETFSGDEDGAGLASRLREGQKRQEIHCGAF